jgi:hypothetical protein
MKRLLLAGIATIGIAGIANAAPIQINIGGSTSGAVTFAGSGTGNISVSNTALSGTATDPTLGTVGSYTIGATASHLFLSAGAGVWNAPAGDTATFSYTNGANSLAETWTYTSVNDGSVNPHLFGTDVVTAISGSAAFLLDFGGVGRASTFDYTVNTVGTLLDALALTTNSESVGLSSGEVVPSVRTPEPGSLAMLGIGLLGLGFVASRKRSS